MSDEPNVYRVTGMSRIFTRNTIARRPQHTDRVTLPYVTLPPMHHPPPLRHGPKTPRRDHCASARNRVQRTPSHKYTQSITRHSPPENQHTPVPPEPMLPALSPRCRTDHPMG